jgi:hypothetical protein
MGDPVSLAVVALSYAGAETIGTAIIATALEDYVVDSVATAALSTAVGSAAISGTAVALQGGTANQVLKAAVINGVAAGAGSYVGNTVGNYVGGLTEVRAAPIIAKSVSTSVTVAAVKGTDIEKAALSGLVVGTIAAVNDLPSVKGLPDTVKNVMNNVVAAALTKQDIKTAAVAGLIQSTNILGTVINSNDTLKAAWANPDNKGLVTMAQNAVSYGLAAAIQGKDVNAAVTQSLYTTSAKLLGASIKGELNAYVKDVQDNYKNATKAQADYNDAATKQAAEYKTYNTYADKVNDYSTKLSELSRDYPSMYQQQSDLLNTIKNEERTITWYNNQMSGLKSDYDHQYNIIKGTVDEYNHYLSIYNNTGYPVQTRNDAAFILNSGGTTLHNGHDFQQIIQNAQFMIDSINAKAEQLHTSYAPVIDGYQKDTAQYNDLIKQLNTMSSTYESLSNDLAAYVDSNKAAAETALSNGRAYDGALASYKATLDTSVALMNSSASKLDEEVNSLQNVAALDFKKVIAEDELKTMQSTASAQTIADKTAEIRSLEAQSYIESMRSVSDDFKNIDFKDLEGKYASTSGMTLDQLASEVKIRTFDQVATPEEKQQAINVAAQYKAANGSLLPTETVQNYAIQQVMSDSWGATTVNPEAEQRRLEAGNQAYKDARAAGLNYDTAYAIRDEVLNRSLGDFTSSQRVITDVAPDILDAITSSANSVERLLSFDPIGTQFAAASSNTMSDAGAGWAMTKQERIQYYLENAAEVKGSGITFDSSTGLYRVDDESGGRSLFFDKDGNPTGQSILVTGTSDTPGGTTNEIASDFLTHVYANTKEGDGLSTKEEERYTYAQSVSQAAESANTKEAVAYLKSEKGSIPQDRLDDLIGKVQSGAISTGEAYIAFRDEVAAEYNRKTAANDPLVKSTYDQAYKYFSQAAGMQPGDAVIAAQGVAEGLSTNEALNLPKNLRNADNLADVFQKTQNLTAEETSQLRNYLKAEASISNNGIASPQSVDNALRNYETAKYVDPNANIMDFLGASTRDSGIEMQYVDKKLDEYLSKNDPFKSAEQKQALTLEDKAIIENTISNIKDTIYTGTVSQFDAQSMVNQAAYRFSVAQDLKIRNSDWADLAKEDPVRMQEYTSDYMEGKYTFSQYVDHLTSQGVSAEKYSAEQESKFQNAYMNAAHLDASKAEELAKDFAEGKLKDVTALGEQITYFGNRQNMEKSYLTSLESAGASEDQIQKVKDLFGSEKTNSEVATEFGKIYQGILNPVVPETPKTQEQLWTEQAQKMLAPYQTLLSNTQYRDAINSYAKTGDLALVNEAISDAKNNKPLPDNASAADPTYVAGYTSAMQYMQQNPLSLSDEAKRKLADEVGNKELSMPEFTEKYLDEANRYKLVNAYAPQLLDQGYSPEQIKAFSDSVLNSEKTPAAAAQEAYQTIEGSKPLNAPTITSPTHTVTDTSGTPVSTPTTPAVTAPQETSQSATYKAQYDWANTYISQWGSAIPESVRNELADKYARGDIQAVGQEMVDQSNLYRQAESLGNALKGSGATDKQVEDFKTQVTSSQTFNSQVVDDLFRQYYQEAQANAKQSTTTPTTPKESTSVTANADGSQTSVTTHSDGTTTTVTRYPDGTTVTGAGGTGGTGTSTSGAATGTSTGATSGAGASGTSGTGAGTTNAENGTSTGTGGGGGAGGTGTGSGTGFGSGTGTGIGIGTGAGSGVGGGTSDTSTSGSAPTDTTTSSTTTTPPVTTGGGTTTTPTDTTTSGGTTSETKPTSPTATTSGSGGSGGSGTGTTTKPTGGVPVAGTPSGVSMGDTSSGAWKAPTLFATGLVNTYVPEVKFESPLEAANKVELQKGAIESGNEGTDMTNLGLSQQTSQPTQNGYYNYGVDKSPFALSASPFMNTPSQNEVQTFKSGGQPKSALQAAMNDVEHKGSHYVQGDGGGQDDLIDAKLADGEYVFDADIVSALGDGSNKEGARKLDEMREAIRAHKRSAPINKIPPMAKSPLEYLKGHK